MSTKSPKGKKKDYDSKKHEKEVEEMREVFSLFDKDSDGSISVEEICSVMKSLKTDFKEDQIKQIMGKVDKDGNGEIEFDEFLRMMSGKIGTRTPDLELKEAFAVFDMDGDGFITKHELKTVMTTLGEEIDDDTIDLMIEGVDTDGDGDIDFPEFKKMMAAGPQ